MIFIGYDPVGITLKQVMSECSVYTHGVSVFVLSGEKDMIGKRVSTGFSLRTILKNHPELRDARVVLHDDFFGESVFRVRKENYIESKTN